MEIIKGKPMPEKRFRVSKYSVVEQMEVGDCVIIDSYKGVSAINHRLRRSGKRSASRELPEGGIGVWRTE